MTEAEYEACSDPMLLVEEVRERVSSRQLRLFACACWRRALGFHSDDRKGNARAVAVAERLADGTVNPTEVRKAQDHCNGQMSWLFEDEMDFTRILPQSAEQAVRDADLLWDYCAMEGFRAAMDPAWQAFKAQWHDHPQWCKARDIEERLDPDDVNAEKTWEQGFGAWGHARNVLGWDPPRDKYESTWNAAWAPAFLSAWQSKRPPDGGVFQKADWCPELAEALDVAWLADMDSAWQWGPWLQLIRLEEAVEAWKAFSERLETEGTNIEQNVQARLFRDIVGPLPFREIAIDPAWLSYNAGTVVDLAHKIAAERAFADLPILADALEEAGCTQRDLLTYCRHRGSHVYGCWAVELLCWKG